MIRRLIAVALVSIGLVIAGVFGQLSAAATGTVITMKVAPVDPIDPLRGAYVALSYPSITKFATEADANEPVYVTVGKSGDTWEATSASRTRPASGTYLACQRKFSAIECGASSYFLPQTKAAEFNWKQSRVATLKVDSRGRVFLVGVN